MLNKLKVEINHTYSKRASCDTRERHLAEIQKKTFFHTKSHSFTGPHPPQIPHDAGVYDLNLVVTGVSSLNIGFV